MFVYISYIISLADDLVEVINLIKVISRQTLPLNCLVASASLLAAETRRPIAHSAHRIVAQIFRTGILPADHSARLKFGTRDELPARQRMWEVTLVQALDETIAVQYHLEL